MSGFVELRDFEGNPFIVARNQITLVFEGGVVDDDEWEGEPCIVGVISGNPTKLMETLDEMREILL